MLDKLTQKYYNWSIPIINKASHEGETMKIIKVKDQLEGAKVGLDILKKTNRRWCANIWFGYRLNTR